VAPRLAKALVVPMAAAVGVVAAVAAVVVASAMSPHKAPVRKRSWSPLRTMLLIMVRKTPTIYMEQPTSLPRTRPLPFPRPILYPALRRTLDAVATAETVV